MRVNLIMPYWWGKGKGTQEDQLINWLESEEGKKLNINYDITDLRAGKNLENFDYEYDASIVFKGELLTDYLFGRMTGIKFLYFPDDILVYPQYAALIKQYGPYYDIVSTFDKKSIQMYYQLGCKNVKWLPSCTWTDLFYDKHINRDIDIAFIGSMNDKRKSMIEIIKVRFSDKKLFFADNIRGKEYADILRRTKICLNLAQGISGTSQRVFEASACKCLVATNYIEEGERLYNETEICYYRDFNDLINQLNIYLENNSKRCLMAMFGYQRTRSEHLISHRFKQILRWVIDFK